MAHIDFSSSTWLPQIYNLTLEERLMLGFDKMGETYAVYLKWVKCMLQPFNYTFDIFFFWIRRCYLLSSILLWFIPCKPTIHRTESFKKKQGHPTESLRFGVYQGESLNFMARLLQAERPPVTLYGFDSFQGLPGVTRLKKCFFLDWDRWWKRNQNLPWFILLSVLGWKRLVSRPCGMYTYIYMYMYMYMYTQHRNT